MDTNLSMLAASWLGLSGSIIEFIIGLGLMVFVHELGHFLAAKAVGIKVERFALGFGPRLTGFQRGETDYCINVLPLGGYIKMLGQEDFAPLKEDEKPDPRSYNAKSVGARMLVISAGVIMNAITGVIMFTIIAMIGYNFPAPVIGSVLPHFPAAEAKITWVKGPHEAATTQPTTATALATRPAATGPKITWAQGPDANSPSQATSIGLKPGDRILRIDGSGAMLSIMGRKATRFDRLTLLSAMSSSNQKYLFTIQREVDGKTWIGKAEVGVKMSDGKLAFGLGPAMGTEVMVDDTGVIKPPQDPFEKGDKVLSVAGEKITEGRQVNRVLENTPGLTLPVTVERDGKQVHLTATKTITSKDNVAYLPDGKKLNLNDYDMTVDDGNMTLVSYDTGKKTSYPMDDLDIPLANTRLDMLGMAPRLAVQAISSDSPAAKADIKSGDVIVYYGDTHLPTNKQLHEINDKALEKDQTNLTLRIERDGNQLPSMEITPIKRHHQAMIGMVPQPDLANPVIGHVRKNSVAAKAGLKAGNVIEKINGRDVANWADIFTDLKDFAGKEVSLTVRELPRDAKTREVKITPEQSGTFDPDNYRFTMFTTGYDGFGPMTTLVRADGTGDAMMWSLRESAAWMVSSYLSIRSLIVGNVSAKQFAGPLGMGSIAVQMAERGFMHFFYFMAIISAILAVMNFLPLPVVDGGHAVFLIIEKIRGKPLPVKVMNITQLIGLIFLGLVFLALTYQDIMRLLS